MLLAIDMQPRQFMEEIERRFDDLRHEILSSWGESRLREGLMVNGPRLPTCDLVEATDAYELTVELPGIDKQDLRVDVDAHGAHIRAEHREERKEERKGFVRQERSSRSFERYVTFPEEVAPDGVRATFNNGVLDIRAPKLKPEKRNSRHIEIS